MHHTFSSVPPRLRAAALIAIPQWHNGRSLGYEPWLVGFQESWLPEQYIHLDNLMQCVTSCVTHSLQRSSALPCA
jgi:hypothetical protein